MSGESTGWHTGRWGEIHADAANCGCVPVAEAAPRESLAERVRTLADEWETQGAGPDSMMRKTGVLYAARLRALLDDPEPPTRDDVYARMDAFIAAAMDGNLAENLTDAWLDGSLARALSGDA